MVNQRLAETARQRHRDQWGRFLNEEKSLVADQRMLEHYAQSNRFDQTEGMLSGQEKTVYVRQLSMIRGKQWNLDEAECEQLATLMEQCNNYVRLSNGQTVELLRQPPIVFPPTSMSDLPAAHDRFMRENLSYRCNLNVDAWENLDEQAGRPYLMSVNNTLADPAKTLTYDQNNDMNADHCYLSDEDMYRLSEAEHASREQYYAYLEQKWVDYTTPTVVKQVNQGTQPLQLEKGWGLIRPLTPEPDFIQYHVKPVTPKGRDDNDWYDKDQFDMPQASQNMEQTQVEAKMPEQQADPYTTMGYDLKAQPLEERLQQLHQKQQQTPFTSDNDRTPVFYPDDYKPRINPARTIFKALTVFTKFVWRL